MAQPYNFILRDVRCFQDLQKARLRPLTLLVGENSTGKTSFLGCYSVLHRMLSTPSPFFVNSPDFNEEPFSMGSFRDIVRSRRGPSGRINEFQLGFDMPSAPNGAPEHRFLVTFFEQGSEPIVYSYRYEFSDESYLELSQASHEGTVIRTREHTVEVDLPWSFSRQQMPLFLSGDWLVEKYPELRPVIDFVSNVLSGAREGERTEPHVPMGLSTPALSNLLPVAPLRAKPKRTYDPIKETATPGGEHIPMLMMRLNHSDRRNWRSLHKDLIEFGRESGLFMDIRVKHHGKQMSDPFQIQVRVLSGSHANLMDVGYGVSQSLPILVDVMAAEHLSQPARAFGSSAYTFVLQQPEVHLHPRGQAELGSLFVRFIKSAKRRSNSFLIETHSDYIIDRIRISVRKGLVEPDDVSILYFEPQRSSVVIHNIAIDDDGNLRGVPAGYRDFFLRETDQLLGFSE